MWKWDWIMRPGKKQRLRLPGMGCVLMAAPSPAEPQAHTGQAKARGQGCVNRRWGSLLNTATGTSPDHDYCYCLYHSLTQNATNTALRKKKTPILSSEGMLKDDLFVKSRGWSQQYISDVFKRIIYNISHTFEVFKTGSPDVRYGKAF